MRCVHSTPRRQRAFLRRFIGSSVRLMLLSPSQHGKAGWRFGLSHNGVAHVLPAIIATRDDGRALSIERFGCKAIEPRVRRRKVA